MRQAMAAMRHASSREAFASHTKAPARLTSHRVSAPSGGLHAVVRGGRGPPAQDAPAPANHSFTIRSRLRHGSSAVGGAAGPAAADGTPSTPPDAQQRGAHGGAKGSSAAAARPGVITVVFSEPVQAVQWLKGVLQSMPYLEW